MPDDDRQPEPNQVDIPMNYEVEKKFWLDSADRVVEQLARDYQAEFTPPREQIDKYFSHPARDFFKTDEALRMRQIGEKNFITYKGARIDSTTKTRRELEVSLPDGDYACTFEQLLIVLGFQPLMTIHKLRRSAELTCDDYRIEVCIDEIDQLGSSFIELETTSDLEHLDRAKHALEVLAKELALDRQERRSYLELMIHQLGPSRFCN